MENEDKKNWKPSNPKDIVGVRKVAFDCLSWPVIAEMAVGMHEGAFKYGRHNYREEGVCASTYFSACLRHLVAWFEGEDIDPDSGLHHLTKLMTSVMVIRDAQLNGKEKDDRPIRIANPNWLKDLNERTSDLCDKYPNPKQPHTHKPLF